MEKLKDYDSLFDEKRLRDGYEYYKSGAVYNVIKRDNSIKALVKGRLLYRISFNQKTKEMTCSCPYGLNCKHLAALLFYLQENPPLEVELMYTTLAQKSKGDLLIILKKIIDNNPKFVSYVHPFVPDLPKEIKRMKICDYREIDAVQEKVENLINSIKEQTTILPNLHLLLERLIELADQGWNHDFQLEYCFEIVIKEINLQLQKMNSKDKTAWNKKIKEAVKEHDFLLDYLDEN